MSWWQRIPEHIDPIALSFGVFSLSWYGIAFLCGVVFSLLFLWKALCQSVPALLSSGEFLDFSLYLLAGTILGARLGYVLFYNVAFFAAHPIAIVSPFSIETGAWTGIAGMSAHGGILGMTSAVILFSWRYGKSVWVLLDSVAWSLPLAIFFGRIGNFLAGELFGRVTSVPWGMVFPHAADGLLHHPSQLYEAVGEGLLLWCVLTLLSKRLRSPGQLFVWALGAYGGIRFLLEYFRAPDSQIGFIAGVFTLGQLLSLCVLFASGVLLLWIRSGKNAILPRTE